MPVFCLFFLAYVHKIAIKYKISYNIINKDMSWVGYPATPSSEKISLYRWLIFLIKSNKGDI